MKWKLDENVPAEVAEDLRGLGDDVHSVLAEGLSGADDATIAARAQAEGRVLITLDKELGDIRRFPPSHFAGIVLVRLAREGRAAVRDVLRRARPALAAQDLAGRLAVVSEDSVRLRPRAGAP